MKPDTEPRTWQAARLPVDRAAISLLTLAALAARLPGVSEQPLQWDEGWSIAVARLPIAEALRITALDVHPPLFYGLLHMWQGAVGSTPFSVRAPSLLAGTLSVPLAAVAARAWWPAGRAQAGARRLAGWAAGLAVALAPPLVYYAGVGRMYALAAAGILATAWGVGAWLEVGGSPIRTNGRRRRRLALAVAVAGSVAALLSFYYSGFVLAGLGLAALSARPRAWRRCGTWAGLSAVAVAPWLIFALPPLVERMSARAVVGEPAGGLPFGLLWEAWRSLVFVNTGTDSAAAVVAVVLLAGLVATWLAAPGDGAARARLAAVALPALLVGLAAALGAGAHMFAPRYVSVATPCVALGLGWLAAGARLPAARSRALVAASAAVALAVTAWPTLGGAVHARSAEWFEPYDPAAIHRAVVEVARPRDVVAFNILSLAGAYDSAADAAARSVPPTPSPPWTYAQLWDPVHEPVKPARQRVEDAFEAALRGPSPGTAALWLVLYKGTAAADTAELKAWADEVYFPHGGRWVGDTLLAGFIEAPTDRTRSFEPAAELDEGITLRRVRHTARAPAGGNVAVSLRWQAIAVPRRDARVVVRLVGADGRTLARRESVPVSESRPFTTWHAGETLDDRHGLRLPFDVVGPDSVRLVVGLVDAADESLVNEVDVGAVEVVAP